MAALKYRDGNGVWQAMSMMSTMGTHLHGNITNEGRIGAVSGKVLMTSTDGMVIAADAPETFNPLDSYPIGAVYQSTASISPATLFGGTWSALGGRFLIGVDGTYTNGTTGGAETHTHGLAAGHANISLDSTYICYIAKGVTSYLINREANQGGGVYAPSSVYKSLATSLGGATDSGSTMPPYLAVFMWKRTA